MTLYRYQGIDSLGRVLSGEIDAINLEVARQALVESGLSITSLGVDGDGAGYLDDADAASIVEELSQATRSSIPLSGTLRAYAEEVRSRRLRRKLVRLYETLEAGGDLETALQDPALRLPKAVSVILKSGLPPQAISYLLSETVRSAASATELRARMLISVFYPIAVIVAVVGLWGFLLGVVTPAMEAIFSDFGTQLPGLTLMILSLSRAVREVHWVGLIIVLMTVTAVGIKYFLLRLNKVSQARVFSFLPVVGTSYRLTALAELSRLLGVLLTCRIPLPDALEWSGRSNRDAELRDNLQQVTELVRAGEPLLSVVETRADLSPYLQQILRFAARGAASREPLEGLARVFDEQINIVARLALPLLEPILLIASAFSVALYFVAFFLPLIKLLNDLS